MRDVYALALGKEIRYLVIETRERLGLTQRQMSELLHMSESSYSDIETGVTKCVSVVTGYLLQQIVRGTFDYADFSKRVDEHKAKITDKTNSLV